MHQQNAFLTLTYADEHLPPDYGVHVKVWQDFNKRLRKQIEPKKIKFYACGEYGDKSLRPHYHALIFGHQFSDLVLWSIKRGQRLYTSKSLDKIWPYGLATTGSVTYQSAAYVARYVMKKIGGDNAPEHYTRRHPVTGEWHVVRHEFAVQSRRPGIGSTWYDKYKSDAFPSDYIIVDGKKHPVPRYYTKKLEEEEHEAIIRQRKKSALQRKPDNSKERRAVKAAVRDARLQQLKREL